MFWENHDPTQGMRQGNDVGTQYRSGIYYFDEEQRRAAEASRDAFQEQLTAAGYGAITTEILPAPEFYYAEDYHQQYLAKNPDGYCGLGGTGVSCPVGVRRPRERRNADSRPQDLSAVSRLSVPRRPINPLPIDPFVDQIVDRVGRSRAAVITAAPGAGKTTRVPPALLDDGPVILLQPRRVAARAIASRIADERGWTLGREVGWQIRFERRFSAETRLLVVTEGVLTARLQSDPLLSDFTTIILDEFHERSIHADLALALARQAWRARDDLRIVVMSATLEAQPVSAFLDGCPVIDVPGRAHPLEISYTPASRWPMRRSTCWRRPSGQVLCFLPGAAEIRRAVDDLQQRIARRRRRSFRCTGRSTRTRRIWRCAPSSHRRVIVATNIAETSLTVPGVTAVVDAGLQKVARYDAERGIDSLETERITADAADQRAGRAGRLAPGVVRRLWDARDRLRPHREAEIHRDRSGRHGARRHRLGRRSAHARVVRAAARGRARGGAGAAVAPRPDRTAHHAPRTQHLVDVDADRAKQVRRLPLHPRLARMLVDAGGARSMAQACALLSERHLLPPRTATTSSDLLSALDGGRTCRPTSSAWRASLRISDCGLRI